MKKIVSLLLVLIFILTPLQKTSAADNFSDVKSGHWAYESVMELKRLGITTGVGGNKFGLGETLTRAQFITFLCNLMKWEPANHAKGSYADNEDTGKWYFGYIETALINKAITTESKNIRPNEPITRDEMAVMLVRSMKLDGLGQRLSYLQAPFSDVTNNIGYITIAKDLGIISGIGGNLFAPAETATREQAAAMMVRMYNIQNTEIDNINGFYAIQSAEQINYISDLDSVSFGWCRLEISGAGLRLNTSRDNENVFSLPSGYAEPYSLAKTKMLMIAVSENESAVIINNSTLRTQAADIISETMREGLNGSINFDGVVLDFEGLKGNDTKNNYTLFLMDLKNKLSSKKIYVAVQPQRRPGVSYYDGYDFKAIGDLADKVILMAHDYNSKALTDQEMASGIVKTPQGPLDEIYYALKSITDEKNGIKDKNKIMVQLNFATVQWKTVDGKVINKNPYTPSYDAIISRIDQGAERKFDEKTQSPYITFYEPSDNSQNYVWYEDQKSVSAKLDLIKLFGIRDISLWRLGTIPAGRSDIDMNVWETIMKYR